MKVSIIIPYVRPDKVKRTILMAEENHGVDEIEILTLGDDGGKGCPKKVKELTDLSKFDLVCFIADDTLPQKDFLKYACRDMEKFKDGTGLVGLNDLSGRFLPCHWLAHKDLLPMLGGEFFHTGYHHCCCDVELMERCIENGKFLYSIDSVVIHDHPFFTGKQADEFYIRAYSKQDQDRALLIKRRKNRWKT
jgi:hypothetical protein